MMEDKVELLMEEIREYRKSRVRIERLKLLLLAVIALALIFNMIFCCRMHPSPALNDVVKWVYDEDGHPLCGAVVTLAYDSEGNEIYGYAITNCRGKAVFHNVPYGTYYLNVSYCYCGEWYYGEEDWEEITVDSDITLENYLPGLHIGELGDGAS